MIMKCKISFEEQLEIWKKRIIHVAPLGIIQIKLSKFKKEIGKKTYVSHINCYILPYVRFSYVTLH